MNRRQALLALVVAPGAVQEAQSNITYRHTFSNGLRFIMALNDKEKAMEDGGVYELEVTYAGKKMTFTAKEIWEALSQNDVPVARFTSSEQP